MKEEGAPDFCAWFSKALVAEYETWRHPTYEPPGLAPGSVRKAGKGIPLGGVDDLPTLKELNGAADAGDDDPGSG